MCWVALENSTLGEGNVIFEKILFLAGYPKFVANS